MSVETQVVKLRALEKSDLSKVHDWENSEELWRVSDTRIPLSKEVVERHMIQSTNIYAAGQLRLGVECDGSLEGIVDLYDCDFYHMRAHVGLFIVPSSRCKGLGANALIELADYAREHLRMRNLFAEVSGENHAAQKVFALAGYQEVGRRSESHFNGDRYVDELLFQKVL